MRQRIERSIWIRIAPESRGRPYESEVRANPASSLRTDSIPFRKRASRKNAAPILAVADRVTQKRADGRDLSNVNEVVRSDPHKRVAQTQA